MCRIANQRLGAGSTALPSRSASSRQLYMQVRCDFGVFIEYSVLLDFRSIDCHEQTTSVIGVASGTRSPVSHCQSVSRVSPAPYPAVELSIFADCFQLPRAWRVLL